MCKRRPLRWSIEQASLVDGHRVWLTPRFADDTVKVPSWRRSPREQWGPLPHGRGTEAGAIRRRLVCALLHVTNREPEDQPSIIRRHECCD
jgi:hypothetical protein